MKIFAVIFVFAANASMHSHTFHSNSTVATTKYLNKNNNTTDVFTIKTPSPSVLECEGRHNNTKVLLKNSSCYSSDDAINCFHDPMFCEKYFPRQRELSDDRPAYGEYSQLDHKNWIRIIQHGGIAFLYHPCVSDEEKEKLREIAVACLHRYILAPYEKLSVKQPIGIISWGCFYTSSTVNKTDMKSFIRGRANDGPASHVTTNGKFQTNLLEPSSLVTDEKDQILCPSAQERNRFTVIPTTQITEKKKDPESIIEKRLDNALHKRDKTEIKLSTNITLTKVEKGNAAWAAGSLLFLLGVLISVLLYTKMWSHEEKQYRYNRLQDHSDAFEYEAGHSNFSLLKSSQKFMSVFKREDKNERRLDSMSYMNLMVPINEEDEEEETLFRR